MKKQKNGVNPKQETSSIRPQSLKSNDSNNKIVAELKLKLDAASNVFERAALVINKEVDKLHQQDKEIFPCYNKAKPSRYWFMPFKVRDAYNGPTFPKPFDVKHGWNSASANTSIHKQVLAIWDKFQAMELARNKLEAAQREVNKVGSTQESIQAAISRVATAKAATKQRKESMKPKMEVIKIPIKTAKIQRTVDDKRKGKLGTIKVIDIVADDKERRAKVALFNKTFNVTPGSAANPFKRTKVMLRIERAQRKKFKSWARLFATLRRINSKRRKDKEKKTYLTASIVLSGVNFRHGFKRGDRVKASLFYGSINKTRWPKSKVLQTVRGNLVDSSLGPRRLDAGTAKMVPTPTPVVNNDWKFKNTKKLVKNFNISGFKYLSHAHDRIEQFSTDLSKYLIDSLVLSIPLAIVRDSSYSDSLNTHSDSIKSERSLLIGYNALVKKFYNDKLKRKVVKTLPAYRGIKYAVEFIKQTGTRKGNRLIRDGNSNVLTELVKWKRDDLFYRERKNLFKLRILLDRFFGGLYDQNDVRDWMSRLRHMDVSNYLMRNTLLHRKNLKVAAHVKHRNLRSASLLVRHSSA